MWVGVGPVAASPSPNVQAYEIGRPLESVDFRPLNVIADPTLTEMLVNPMLAVGGMSKPNARENSEVLPLESVAVAETNRDWPVGFGNWKLKLALPIASVMTDAEPRTYRPSP